jgi:hypothetical protein
LQEEVEAEPEILQAAAAQEEEEECAASCKQNGEVDGDGGKQEEVAAGSGNLALRLDLGGRTEGDSGEAELVDLGVGAGVDDVDGDLGWPD